MSTVARIRAAWHSYAFMAFRRIVHAAVIAFHNLSLQLPALGTALADEAQVCIQILTSVFGWAYCLVVFARGRMDPMSYFQLQAPELELQQLAEQYWQEAGERERQLERDAYEAGEAIRGGEYTLPNLEIIVRWKSERVVHYLIGNSKQAITQALTIAAAPETSTEDAVNALVGLRGIDIPIASAILAAIHPERYAVLDYRALEALGHARHDVHFYAEYNAFFNRLVECGMMKPQQDLPAPTPLHALERALWQWSRSKMEEQGLVGAGAGNGARTAV